MLSNSDKSYAGAVPATGSSVLLYGPTVKEHSTLRIQRGLQRMMLVSAGNRNAVCSQWTKASGILTVLFFSLPCPRKTLLMAPVGRELSPPSSMPRFVPSPHQDGARPCNFLLTFASPPSLPPS